MFKLALALLLTSVATFCNAEGSAIIIGTPIGAAISNDHGTSWQTHKIGHVNAIFPMENQTYVGTTRGLIETTDKGKTWTHKFSGNVKKIAICLDNPNVMSLGLDNNRLTISNDGGRRWTSTKIIPFELRDMAIQKNNLYVATIDGISVARNMTNWETEQIGPVWSIALGCNTVYIGTSNGVFRTTDQGRNWVPWGLQGNNITSVYIDGATLYTYGDTSRLSIRKANAWRNGLGVDKVTSIFAEKKNIYLGRSNGGGLAISRDGGQTWVTKKKEDGLLDDSVTAVSILEY